MSDSNRKRFHVVRAGEHLTQIAWRHGVDRGAVLDMPDNQYLSEERDPDQLRPGDVLVLPPRPDRGLSIQPGGEHAYRAVPPRVEAHVQLQGADGPLAGESFVVEGLPGPDYEGTTDGEGVAVFELPATASEAELVVPAHSLRFRVRPGALDPADDETGTDARLHHLGYLRNRDAEEREAAVRRFQEDEGLPTTGEIDQATQDAIVERHGS